MAWRFVKQPNGLYARFSDVVDHFTHLHMTYDEAIDVCQDYMGRQEAPTKVKNADAPEAANRWQESLDTIKNIHGKAEMIKVLAEYAKTDPMHPNPADKGTTH